MLKLAFIGTRFEDQIRANPAALTGIEVAWIDREAYEQRPGEARAAVLVCDLADLGPDPVQRVEELLSDPRVERLVVIYDFARRAVLLGLHQPRVRVVQGPLSLANLRAQLVDLIIREILEDDAPSPRGEPEPACPECGGPMPARRRKN